MLRFRLFALAACILAPLTVTAQLRDMHVGRLILDDDGQDGGFHRLLISIGALPTDSYLRIPTPLDSSSGYFLISNPSTPGGQQMSGPFSIDELRLMSSGTSFYNSFISPAGMTGNITYTLPLSTVPSATVANGLLQLDSATGQLTWVDPSAVVGATTWSLSGNAGTTAGTNFIGTTDSVPLHLRVNNVDRMIFNTSGSIQVDSGGDARGFYAVDFQALRDSSMQVASGGYSVIAGGAGNTAAAIASAVGGGSNNTASGGYAFIGGGSTNTASKLYATVAGGVGNIASEGLATVAGGGGNMAVGGGSAIGGGQANTASENFSVVGGGTYNTASGEFSTVAGGFRDTASGESSTIGGGSLNIGSGPYSMVAGGGGNTASGEFSVIGGGISNIASGSHSVIAGGRQNRAAGAYSAIAGGNGLTLDSSASGSFGYLGGSTIVTPNYMTISAPEVAVFGNTDLWLANNDTAASQLRFYESNMATGAFPGTTNYTSFEAGNQSEDITYILPTSAPASNGQLLSSDTNGVMSWVDGLGGSQSFANASNTTSTLALANSAAGDDGTALEISDGRVLLSNAIGAPATLPDDVSVYAIDDGTASSVPVVTLPIGGSAGQILYIYVSDPDGATVGGTAQTSGTSLIYIYVVGGWRLF